MMHPLTGWSLRRRGSFLATLTLGLVIMADWLFYGEVVGWTAGGFGALLLAAVTLRSGRYLHTTPGRAVAAATVGLLAALLIHPSPLAVALGMLGLITLASIDRCGWTSSVTAWGWRWATFLGRGVTQPLRDGRTQHRWQNAHGYPGGAGKTGAAILWGWLVPVLLAAVFVGLFAAANPVVQRTVQQGWDAVSGRLLNLGDFLAPSRIILWAATATAVWALLRVRIRARQRATTAGRVTGQFDRFERTTGTGWVVRCLVLFNAVFAVQTTLDLAYLWGGVALPEGMTYAQYAHRGAYPLVVTALLAGAFVLLTFRPGGAAQRSRAARRLVGVWIAQNILLMASAVWRLNLYVEAYSLTRWRVAAAVWMLLVAIGFAWLVWRIVADRDHAWLLQRLTLTAAAVLYATCFVNLDGSIARYNINHCAEMGGSGPPLDLAYLQRLGPAALPATRRLLTHATLDPDRLDQARAVHHTLDRQLTTALADWRGWTLRRAHAAAGSPTPLR